MSGIRIASLLRIAVVGISAAVLFLIAFDVSYDGVRMSITTFEMWSGRFFDYLETYAEVSMTTEMEMWKIAMLIITIVAIVFGALGLVSNGFCLLFGGSGIVRKFAAWTSTTALSETFTLALVPAVIFVVMSRMIEGTEIAVVPLVMDGVLIIIGFIFAGVAKRFAKRSD